MGNIALIQTFRKEEQVPETRDRKVSHCTLYKVDCRWKWREIGDKDDCRRYGRLCHQFVASFGDTLVPKLHTVDHLKPIQRISSTAAYSIADWCVCLYGCVSSIIFQISTPPIVFLWVSRNLVHTICAHAQKTDGTDLWNFGFKIFGWSLKFDMLP